jgi:hypothetical protein
LVGFGKRSAGAGADWSVICVLPTLATKEPRKTQRQHYIGYHPCREWQQQAKYRICSR